MAAKTASDSASSASVHAKNAAGIAVAVMPARADHDRHQHGGQQDHQQPEPVDTQGVVDAEGLDPGVLLLELHAVADVVGRGDHDADDQRGEARAETGHLAERGGQEGDRERAGERQRRSGG